jgi:transglutaminase-like putative cysteine protease
MKLEIEHDTRYRYERPVQFSRNELRLKPRTHPHQTLHSFSLEVHPSAQSRVRSDYYGNNVHICKITVPHETLSLTARSVVSTRLEPGKSEETFGNLTVREPELQEFLLPTDLIPMNKDWSEIFDVRAPESSTRIQDHLEYLLDHFNELFDYDKTTTNVETDLVEFSKHGTGVCQDFAHSLAALCRQWNIPTRYVSGYIKTGQGSDASHAWVECYTPDAGWLGLDPTNNQFVDEQYVRLAYGRDYNDCSPVRGIRRGGGPDTMSIKVSIEKQE